MEVERQQKEDLRSCVAETESVAERYIGRHHPYHHHDLNSVHAMANLLHCIGSGAGLGGPEAKNKRQKNLDPGKTVLEHWAPYTIVFF